MLEQTVQCRLKRLLNNLKDLPAHQAKSDVQVATQMVIASSTFSEKKLNYEMGATAKFRGIKT